MGLLDIRAPTSLRLAWGDSWDPVSVTASSPFAVFKKPQESHPSIDNLVLLVFGAVLEVVCVSLPGYIIARLGHFDAEKQKFLANLNVMLFTPCLSKSRVFGWSNGGCGLTVGSFHQACIAVERR